MFFLVFFGVFCIAKPDDNPLLLMQVGWRGSAGYHDPEEQVPVPEEGAGWRPAPPPHPLQGPHELQPSVPLGQGPEDCIPRRDTEGGFLWKRKNLFSCCSFSTFRIRIRIQQFPSMRIRCQASSTENMVLYQCCWTVTIYYISGFVSDFCHVMVPAPAPYLVQKSSFYKDEIDKFHKIYIKCEWKKC